MTLAQHLGPLPGSAQRRLLRFGHHASVRQVRSQADPDVPLGGVVVFDHRLPTLDRESGSFRMMEIIQAIRRRGHNVTLIPDNMAVFAPYHENLKGLGVRVIHPSGYVLVEDYFLRHGRELMSEVTLMALRPYSP